ncbi:hypothetical protein P691DRAFT_757391 [Macrolepiota fuliginosa MF-IS2]|uniref:Uncharacterized protein n=1 Tax=Macrolepiota fuliginosa MF-IS2 TaxID=1400762 RepID=A0A9P6C7N7_9AGAR|nr:hypothetical protein P691DRAFT_757391 [Macrolepiota fuliginosa MF-IS2]
MSSITAYLCTSPILFTNTPTYDDKGRQQSYAESRLQRRERRAFVKSLQWQRNVATWVRKQHHTVSVSQSPSPDVPSSSSSESSSPRTPASPLNTPHTHTHKQHKQQQAALDAELAKLALASTVAQSTLPYPEQRQPHKRNYKNLHLANTTHTPRYQPQTRVPQQQPRVQAPSPLMRTPTRGIFDSSSYTYPSTFSAEDEDQMDGGEPYIFYSSTATKRSSPTAAPAAGIGEFPCPTPHTSSSIQTSSLQSPSSSSHPRALTTGPPTKLRQIGDH